MLQSARRFQLPLIIGDYRGNGWRGVAHVGKMKIRVTGLNYPLNIMGVLGYKLKIVGGAYKMSTRKMRFFLYVLTKR